MAALYYEPMPRVAELSFGTMVVKPSTVVKMDPTLVKIEVGLRLKCISLMMDRLGQVYDESIIHKTIGQSNVLFDFRVEEEEESIGLYYFRDEFHGWVRELEPSVCDRLSQDIVQYARRAALTHGGAIIVRASIEAKRETHFKMHLNLQDLPNFTVSSEEDLPRGLSLDEINELKQESFVKRRRRRRKNNDASVCCSVCLEEFVRGVKITQLQCSHTFHHSCIGSWLEKQASCPLCRLNIIKARNCKTTFLLLDNTVMFTGFGTSIVAPVPSGLI